MNTINRGCVKSLKHPLQHVLWMASSRAVKTFITAFASVLAGLIAASTYLFLQHEEAMRGMMGGVMPGMMWMPLAFAALLAVAVLVPVVVYLTASGGGGVRVAGLTPQEQAVVNYLKRRGGEATQKEIAQDLNISRLKAYRLIASLRRRGVVSTTPHGRTNIVRLTAGHMTEQT